MWTIANDDPDVCLSVMWAGYAKLAELIDVLFGMEAFWNQRNVLFDGGDVIVKGFYATFVKLLCALV